MKKSPVRMTKMIMTVAVMYIASRLQFSEKENKKSIFLEHRDAHKNTLTNTSHASSEAVYRL